MSEWISVKDRLPEKNTMVLVRDTSFAKTDLYDMSKGYGTKRPAGVRFGYVSSIGLRVDGCNGNTNITHWMPLPPPPEDK